MALPVRDIRPPQCVILMQSSRNEVDCFEPSQAKAEVLGIREVVAFWLEFLRHQMHQLEWCSLPRRRCSQNLYALFLSRSYIDSQRQIGREYSFP
ncbi:Myosin-XV-like protein [Daphnia magna]|uniref:Myosin-XV-like protein n=1 Tax=Daphnia magna TaxID=35525 RepID=A0A164HGF5_9CRUS|nr:Myosin-XV-like protein [Daphnia magna]